MDPQLLIVRFMILRLGNTFLTPTVRKLIGNPEDSEKDKFVLIIIIIN